MLLASSFGVDVDVAVTVFETQSEEPICVGRHIAGGLQFDMSG